MSNSPLVSEDLIIVTPLHFDKQTGFSKNKAVSTYLVCLITEEVDCQGHSSLDAPSELNLPQRIPSPLFVALLVPQAEG